MAVMGFSWWIGLAVAPTLGAQLLSRSPKPRRTAVVNVDDPAGAAMVNGLTLDVIRFGLTPLYLGFEDLWRAIETLRDILETGR